MGWMCDVCKQVVLMTGWAHAQIGKATRRTHVVIDHAKF